MLNAKAIFRSLWHDTRGQVSFAMMMFLVTIVAIGSVTGLVALRDHIANEFCDVAAALQHLNQSYKVEVTIVDSEDNEVYSYTAEYWEPDGPPPSDACVVFEPLDPDNP